MGWEGMESLIDSLSSQDLIMPYFENSMMLDEWPESYDIKVDSSPYYGRGDGYFHPSSHALMGERQLYYLFHPDYAGKMTPERRTLTSEMTLTGGSAWHAVLQAQMTMAKLIKDPRPIVGDIEHEYRNDEHQVRGRIDWLVTHPNGSTLVVEFKTRNQYSWAKQPGPLPSWVAQTNLAMDNVGLDLGVIIMLEMCWPWRFREFHVKRDQELIDSIYAKFDRVRAAIAANEPPKHCCPPDSKEMEKCPARYSCWLKEEVVA